MGKKMKNCRTCGAIIAKNAKFCPYCGGKNKKPLLKKWWFWVIIIVLLISLISSGEDTDNSSVQDQSASENTQSTVEKESVSSQNSVADEESADDEIPPVTETEYCVGDILEDGNTKIVFMSSGEYTEENEYAQPKEGNKYIYLQFAFENISDETDTSISFYNFECYADGYSTDMHYNDEDELSATLSAGRATTGYIYFEVPIDAQKIEIEYETNFFTEEKIKFIYEGNKDSGYIQKLNKNATEGAYAVGETVESSNLKIVYLSCEEYISDNTFVVPSDGCRFITCEFEFENTGTADEYISSFDFDCYADGLNCNATYIRDDDLQATLSSGRKTKGTVTFEVPVNAEVIEVEYLSNYWTSNRVVFTANVSE